MRNAYQCILPPLPKDFHPSPNCIFTLLRSLTPSLQVHNWVNVESTLKACVVGPLVASSPNTQRKNTSNIIKNAAKHRKESATLNVAKPIIIPDGEWEKPYRWGGGTNRQTNKQRGQV